MSPGNTPPRLTRALKGRHIFVASVTSNSEPSPSPEGERFQPSPRGTLISFCRETPYSFDLELDFDIDVDLVLQSVLAILFNLSPCIISTWHHAIRFLRVHVRVQDQVEVEVQDQ